MATAAEHYLDDLVATAHKYAVAVASEPLKVRILMMNEVILGCYWHVGAAVAEARRLMDYYSGQDGLEWSQQTDLMWVANERVIHISTHDPQ